MVDDMLDSPTFTLRMRELIILRVAHLQRTPYELSQHADLARAAGPTERQIDAILDAGDNGDCEVGLTQTERTVLDVSASCATPGASAKTPSLQSKRRSATKFSW